MTKQQRELNNEMIEAARKGNLEQVKYLLEQGADIETKDNEGYTALILQCFNTILLKLLTVLITN